MSTVSAENPAAAISRRRLLRQFVAGTAYSTLLGRQWVSTVSTAANSTATIYVDRTSAKGFYGVAIQIVEE